MTAWLILFLVLTIASLVGVVMHLLAREDAANERHASAETMFAAMQVAQGLRHKGYEARQAMRREGSSEIIDVDGFDSP